MCKSLIEIQYMDCNHLAVWELPSPSPTCNGIRHHITQTALKLCKHCWVAQGNAKKEWRRAGLRNPAGRRMRIKLSRHTFVYPIQSIGLQRTSECPTWTPRYRWHTRAWAFRGLLLRREDAFDEFDLMRAGKNPDFGVGSIHTIDADTAESALLKLVEPENLTNGQAAGRCSICWGYFAHEDPALRCQAGEGGLRQLPCEFGHAFCLDCIRGQFITIANDQVEAKRRGERPPEHRCPLCLTAWTVRVYSKWDMRKRIEFWFEKYHERMVERFWDGPSGGVLGSQLADFKNAHEYIGTSAAFVLALPTFCAVDHAMGHWGSKNGKLPLDQALVVGATGAVCQSLWLMGIALSPTYIMAYLAYKYMVRLHVLCQQSEYGREARVAIQEFQDRLKHFRQEVLERFENFREEFRRGFEVEYELLTWLWQFILSRK